MPHKVQAVRFGAPLRNAIRKRVIDSALTKNGSFIVRAGTAHPGIRKRALHFFNVNENSAPLCEGHTLLEVGCGNGQWLSSMEDLGWVVTGVDVDPLAVDSCRDAGIQAFCGSLESLSLPESSFQAAALRHTIEHLWSPQQTLQEIHRVLCPGGWLGIITPNAGSLAHALFRMHWYGLEIPRHLQLYTKHSLNRVLVDAGFETHLVYTRAVMAESLYQSSHAISCIASGSVPSMTRMAKLFGHAERRLLRLFPNCGEELLVLARKPV